MRVLTLISMVLLSGCAAIMSGGKQSVTIVTPDVEGANCSLTDAKGRIWYIENTPGTALVRKGDGPIAVICKKDGYQVGTGEIDSSLTPSNYGNLALGPAAPVGYFLDSITGSAEKYDSKVEISMDPVSDKNKKKPWE